MFISRDQNARRSHSIKTYNSLFEMVEEFKYLGTNLKNQNSIREEIKADWSQRKLAIIRCRIFCLPVRCPKI